MIYVPDEVFENYREREMNEEIYEELIRNSKEKGII